MKKTISFLLCLISVISFFKFDIKAINNEEITMCLIDCRLTEESSVYIAGDSARVTGLIYSYGLNITKNGTTLNISGVTNCTTEVVKCGFKNLTVERRKSSSDSWKDYYEYGDLYREATAFYLNTTLTVESGYQYRISCKHYAKKSLLLTQNIENTSNIVTV